MQFREQLWTYALVTGVAVLIWLWAAMETRDEAPASFRIELIPAANQVVEPNQFTVQVQMEGSKLALQNAHQLASREEPLRLTVGTELPSASGEHGLVAALQNSETLTDSGVSIISVNPATIKLLIDELVEVTLPVQVVLVAIPSVSKNAVSRRIPVRRSGRTRTLSPPRERVGSLTAEGSSGGRDDPVVDEFPEGVDQSGIELSARAAG